MIATDAQNDPKHGMPSRTSILVAAARAFGAREPDESVRNPDSLAGLLIGPAELALIAEHPLSKALDQDYAEATQNPRVMFYAAMLLWRTRFIDEALQRALENGAKQVVILGAGFDSRAYRFQDLLKDCRVIEVDAAPTQQYKRRRVEAALREIPANLIYCTVDFDKDSLIDDLRRAGFNESEKAIFIWEGVCMYLPEESVHRTLQTVATHAAPGSSLVMDYANSVGVEFVKSSPSGPGAIPKEWQEPWLFGVPGNTGREFFSEIGFDSGAPLSINNPEMVKRYGTRQDGTVYAGHIFQRMQADAQALLQAPPSALADIQKAVAAAGGGYWFAELTVR